MECKNNLLLNNWKQKNTSLSLLAGMTVTTFQNFNDWKVQRDTPFKFQGAQWLSGRVLDSRPKGCGFEPHWRHFVVSLSKNINPSLVLVQPRKTRPYITERLLMGRKESNQTNKQTNFNSQQINWRFISSTDNFRFSYRHSNALLLWNYTLLHL